MFLKDFTSTVHQLAQETQFEDDVVKMQNLCFQMSTYVRQHRILLNITVPRTKSERIDLLLAKIHNCIILQHEAEARMAAGELKAYVLELFGR